MAFAEGLLSDSEFLLAAHLHGARGQGSPFGLFLKTIIPVLRVPPIILSLPRRLCELIPSAWSIGFQYVILRGRPVHSDLGRKWA